ncbi:MAG: class I SAM-dependent methyltransferase [Rhodospirillaceae bacterium]
MSDQNRDLVLTPEDIGIIRKILLAIPKDMLLSESVRRYVAQRRWEKDRKKHLEIFQHQNLGAMPGTIEHNRRELDEALFGSSKRTLRLLHPLTALEPCYSRPEETRVLSIGPRTEMELLHLIGLGFDMNKVRAVDLISCSPWIDLGDMHQLPYPDKSFDVVLSSWVLNYSNQPQLAVDEMCRVCVDGGLIAIGLTYDPKFGRHHISNAPGEKDIVGSMQRSAADLADLIGDRLIQICFQDEPQRDDEKGAVMLIARIKHWSRSTRFANNAAS